MLSYSGFWLRKSLALVVSIITPRSTMSLNSIAEGFDLPDPLCKGASQGVLLKLEPPI